MYYVKRINADWTTKPAPVPAPRCLGQTGTTRTGCPVFSVKRPDGQIVTVVIPGRDEDEIAYTVTAIQGITRIMSAIVAASPAAAKAQFRAMRPLAHHVRVREYRR